MSSRPPTSALSAWRDTKPSTTLRTRESQTPGRIRLRPTRVLALPESSETRRRGSPRPKQSVQWPG
eukprot:scaffold3411_cov396-Prasinococcus_capsulatus_cf.AAC.5